MASPTILLKTGGFSLLVPGTVAGLIPHWLARRDRLRFPLDPRICRWTGRVVLVAGLLLYLHTAWRFSDEGHGTPAPRDEPDELVTGGVYAHVRNPMYDAVLLCIIGQALLYRSVLVLGWAVGCWIGFHNRVVTWEEPHLTEKHGEQYDQYYNNVARWLPQLRPDPET